MMTKIDAISSPGAQILGNGPESLRSRILHHTAFACLPPVTAGSSPRQPGHCISAQFDGSEPFLKLPSVTFIFHSVSLSENKEVNSFLMGAGQLLCAKHQRHKGQ